MNKVADPIFQQVSKLASLVRLRVAGHRDYKRFIVLSRSRTGSNLLISSLNSHPEIIAESELLKHLHGRSAESILADIFCRRSGKIRAVGFKIFYYHPLDDDRREIWKKLREMEGLLVIHLKRRNILRTLVSRKIAESRNVWSSLEEEGSEPDAEKRVEFSADELSREFSQTRRWENEFDQMFWGKQVLQVIYEDFIASPEKDFNRITEFLGVTARKPSSEFKKQNPEPLVELIRNYSELKREFTDSEWTPFFQDQQEEFYEHD